MCLCGCVCVYELGMEIHKRDLFVCLCILNFESSYKVTETRDRNVNYQLCVCSTRKGVREEMQTQCNNIKKGFCICFYNMRQLQKRSYLLKPLKNICDLEKTID